MTANRGATGMRTVSLARKSLVEYAPLVGDDVIAAIEALALPLRGARVAHVSATASGGGVAEMLRTLVPLMRSVGMDAEWQVISGSESFFSVTKTMHNALQGRDLPLTEAMKTNYSVTNLQNAATFEDDFDFVVVHDPQPAPLRLLSHRGTWIWRCHLDLASPRGSVWQFLRPFIEEYDSAIFTMPKFVPPDLRMKSIAIMPPTIDPLSPKNTFLAADDISTAVAMAGVDPSRPLLLQVSRFDPWKDPLGVIDVYRAVHTEVPDLQLVMLGAMATDDPEGASYLGKTRAYAEDDPEIHLLTNKGGSIEVNAFQRRAEVILQKSLREGFGLTVTEGLWKSRPVVAGNVGGIPLQIEDGISGFLAANTDQYVERVLTVLHEPDVAIQLGANGHNTVLRSFLSTTDLRNYLTLFNNLGGVSAGPSPFSPLDVHPPNVPT